MMSDQTYLSILISFFRYSYDNSIAKNSSKVLAARVVRVKDVEAYLRQNMPETLDEILIKYGSLKLFIAETDYNFVDEEFGNNWKCEITNLNRYNLKLREKKQFLPLKTYVSFRESLFVIYPIERSYLDITEKLTDTINEFLEKYLLPDSQYSVYRGVRNRVNAMVQEVFADKCATAEIIGSAGKGLATGTNAVVMVIHIPPHSVRSDSNPSDSNNWENSPFNFETLSKHLANIGMENIEVNAEINRCLFIDPVTGLKCRLSPDIGLVYERDQMTLEYFKLDKRVKPLIAAVDQFIGRNNIEKSDNFHFLGCTSYTIMVLRFLMCGLEKPIIISLQNLPIDCKSTICRFNRDNGRLLLKLHNEVQELFVKYHDCVRIRDSDTGRCNSVGNFADNVESTFWFSKNKDNLGSLLIDFFDFYSRRRNYKPISIINNDGKPISVDPKEYRSATVFVQDPYVPQKNIAKSCNKEHLQTIIDHFITARDALRNGASFEQICNIHQDTT